MAQQEGKRMGTGKFIDLDILDKTYADVVPVYKPFGRARAR